MKGLDNERLPKPQLRQFFLYEPIRY
ncbi:hypothetical protein MED222_05720 [Vibrio sp. MED222]|nr:hypothetical protein MED222_05720 [Vibrio sp. MED222]